MALRRSPVEHLTASRGNKLYAPAIRLAVLVPALTPLVAVAGGARLAVAACARARRRVQSGVGARAPAGRGCSLSRTYTGTSLIFCDIKVSLTLNNLLCQ